MDNAADRKSVRRLEKQAEAALAQRGAVLRNVLSTIEGRRWLWDTLASCGIFATTFSPDPYHTAFNEGQRAVGLRLLADIMLHCPDLYLQAQRESNERSATDERRSRPVDDGRDSGSGDPAEDGDDPDFDGTHEGNSADRSFGNYN